MRTQCAVALFLFVAGCSVPSESATPPGAPGTGKGDSAAGGDDWHKSIGEFAFVAPHAFEVIQTSRFAVQLMLELGEQRVILLSLDDSGNQVEIASAQTQGGRATLEIPVGTKPGSLYLTMSPWKLSETGSITYWPSAGSGLTGLDYAWLDNMPDHAIMNCQGVAVLEKGAVAIVLRSETSDTELHRYTMAPPAYAWPSWVDPNGYVAFNAPIEAAAIAKAGEILSVFAETGSRTERLGCYRVDHAAESGFNSATRLDACP